MGGCNHQPTRNVSIAFTVPAARALTMAIAQLNMGNVAIEDTILTGGTNFGVQRLHLIDAATHFGGVVTQLQTVKHYVGRVIGTLGSDEYDPFDLSVVNVDDFIAEMIAAGLLSDDVAIHDAVDAIKREGYNGIFFETDRLIDEAIIAAKTLCSTLEPMIDGPEGKQGYFWDQVEANNNTWRADYMRVDTALTTLFGFWKTTGAVCTEVHYVGTDAGSLLDHTGTEADSPVDYFTAPAA